MLRTLRAPLGFGVLLATLALPSLLMTGCGKDDGGAGPGDTIEVPAAWAGIWSIHSVTRNCGSDTVISDDTSDETLCAGDDFVVDEGDFGVDASCTGTVTDTAVDISCSGQTTFEGVTYTYTFTLQATRTGDDFSGTSHTTISAAGETVECFDDVVSAHRVGPAPTPCTGTTAAFHSPRTRVERLFSE